MTYIFVVSFVAFIFAELVKLTAIKNKWIPLINLMIGIISAVICITIGILPTTNPLEWFTAFSSCIIAALGAGGFYDVFKQKYKESQTGNLNYNSAMDVFATIDGTVEAAPVTHDENEKIKEERKIKG